MRILKAALTLSISLVLWSCADQKRSTTETVDKSDQELWTDYSPQSTIFRLWSPEADKVVLNIYPDGDQSEVEDSYAMDLSANGTWLYELAGDQAGKYYTFRVTFDGKELEETPGIYAQAVGVNGKRAMVCDLKASDPEGWENDEFVKLEQKNRAVIYEAHVRDMSLDPVIKAQYPGKFLGLTESGLVNSEGQAAALDHLKEMGITHLHLLPSFDHYSIDESDLDRPQFNWGYDPQNYNVPEGSYSTDPYHAEVRINEFKTMVRELHAAGIAVVLDVVYNHTGRTDNSNFNLEYPGYYYRHWDDGRGSDASGCGNETASDTEMMRKYILESIRYWMEEYHVDAFRFDLMAIHDIETMNAIADLVEEINPNGMVYGEGWTAGDSPLPLDDRALKQFTYRMPKVSAFSDDLRDGLKGSVFDDHSRGFVSDQEGSAASIQMGIVGSIYHPEIDYKAVNYSDTSWTNDPWQAISYVSCHDNHTLFDKLQISTEASMNEIKRMHELALAIVLSSQGVPFLHAGSEFMRTKDGEHNSYNLPDSINTILWDRRSEYDATAETVKALIQFRNDNPILWMNSGDEVREKLHFIEVSDELIIYDIETKDGAYRFVFNAGADKKDLVLDGYWKMELSNDPFKVDPNAYLNNKYSISGRSFSILSAQTIEALN